MSVFQDIKKGVPTKQKAESQDKPSGETDLQKLRRVDLLELLLEQIRKNEVQTVELEQATDLGERLKAKLDQKDEQFERLKAKLDEKDVQLERLKKKLDQKDAKISLLEEHLHELAEKTGAMTLHDLELEEQAIDRYLQQLSTKKDGEPSSGGSHAKRSSISLPEITED